MRKEKLEELKEYEYKGKKYVKKLWKLGCFTEKT